MDSVVAVALPLPVAQVNEHAARLPDVKGQAPLVVVVDRLAEKAERDKRSRQTGLIGFIRGLAKRIEADLEG